MMGGGGIKRGFAWKVLSGPFVLVPLAAKYPLTWRSLCGEFAYQLCHVIFTGTGSGVDIVGAIGRAEKVNVGVNETGKYGSATQVYQLGMQAAVATYLVIAANSQEIACHAINGHSLCHGLGGVHRIDRTVHIEHGAHSYATP